MASLPNRRILRRGLGIIGMSIRLQPKAFAAGLMGSWLYAGMTVAGAAVLGAVTDRVIVPSIERGSIGFGALAGATAAIIGVAILEAVGVFARRTGAFYMVYRLQATFRKRVTEQYQRLSMAWHRNHSTGELLSRANSDVETMFWLIHPLPFACGVIFMVVITLVALALTDLFLTLLGLLMIPAIALLSNVYGKRSNDVATRAQEMRAAVSGVAHESFDGALVVKTLGLEDEETDRFRAESEKLRDELINLGTLRAVFDPVMEALPNVAVLALLAVGTWRIASGDLSTGDVVQFAYLFTRLAFPLRAIGWILGDMPRAVVGWERVKRVLEAGDVMHYGGLHLDPDGSSARLGVRGASFGYEDGDVLRKLDMEVPAGKTIAVVGPTGSGKSTITNLLVRLADPSVGLIVLDDRDLKELRQGVVPDNASIVFQESFLFDDTVRENIVLGEAVDDQAVEEAARLAQAHDFISALPQGYDTIVGERGTTLSGGQRQRVALARALIRRPRLLIMDDATSSVDPSVEQAILQGLRRAALPSTTIVVAYRRATIALADEVVFLRHGTIEARGPHEQLAAQVPAYSRLISAYDFAIEDPPA